MNCGTALIIMFIARVGAFLEALKFWGQCKKSIALKERVLIDWLIKVMSSGEWLFSSARIKFLQLSNSVSMCVKAVDKSVGRCEHKHTCLNWRVIAKASNFVLLRSFIR